MSSEAIKFSIHLDHEYIRDAERNGLLPELIVSTCEQIRTDLTMAVRDWIASQPVKATRRDLKGGLDK